MNRRGFLGGAAGAAIGGQEALRAAAQPQAEYTVGRAVPLPQMTIKAAGPTSDGLAGYAARITPEMRALKREYGQFMPTNWQQEMFNRGPAYDFVPLRSVKMSAKVAWTVQRLRAEDDRRNGVAARLSRLCAAAGIGMPFPWLDPEQADGWFS